MYYCNHYVIVHVKVKYQLGWQELEQENPDMVDIDVTSTTLCHPLCQCSHCALYQQVTTTTTTLSLIHI